MLITNDPLDAAKMNRAVVVHRQAPELDELKLLLCGSMGYAGHGDDPVIVALCTAYHSLMDKREALVPRGIMFRERFGLRDLYSECVSLDPPDPRPIRSYPTFAFFLALGRTPPRISCRHSPSLLFLLPPPPLPSSRVPLLVQISGDTSFVWVWSCHPVGKTSPWPCSATFLV